MDTARDYQRTLGDLWTEVLQLGRAPDGDDNFFELGGDSMTLTLLEFRIKEELGISIPGHQIMSCESLSDLAKCVDAVAARGASA